MSIEKVNNKTNRNIKKIDIKGNVCPMNFVFTKLALEELKKDDLLEVELDFHPAIKSIPNNCKRQGLAELIEKIELEPKEGIWLLKLKKL